MTRQIIIIQKRNDHVVTSRNPNFTGKWSIFFGGRQLFSENRVHYLCSNVKLASFDEIFKFRKKSKHYGRDGTEMLQLAQ